MLGELYSPALTSEGHGAGPEMEVQRKLNEASCHRRFSSAPNSLLTSSDLLQPTRVAPRHEPHDVGFNQPSHKQPLGSAASTGSS